MTTASIFIGIIIYSALISYGMFQIGYNSGFARGYYYVTLVQRAQKKLRDIDNNEA